MGAERVRTRALAGGFALAALLIVWIGNGTDLDLRLADVFFDRASATFPWRHAWLTEVFAHVALKRALIALGLCFVLAAIADLVWPRALGAPGARRALRRAQLRVVALSALLVPAAITLTKHMSASHCPWDLARYGGAEPYVRLLDALPQGMAAGGCMPAGHAATALWLVSLAVFFLPARPRAAFAAALVLLAGGFTVGWMQQMRGAHFLTHTLWSMWIACAIVCLLARRLLPHRLAAHSAAFAAAPVPG
jgi:membrane-associated PAP2 superfamily phosphatase